MKNLSRWFLILAVFVFPGCAPDDEAFDTSTLTPEHQAAFLMAADDVNRAHPQLADFSAGSGGWSVVEYGQPNPGSLCTLKHEMVNGLYAYRIVCDYHAFINVSVGYQRIALSHELCHIIGFDHDNGNPVYGTCAAMIGKNDRIR